MKTLHLVPADTAFDFINKRLMAFALSAALVVASREEAERGRHAAAL